MVPKRWSPQRAHPRPTARHTTIDVLGEGVVPTARQSEASGRTILGTPSSKAARRCRRHRRKVAICRMSARLSSKHTTARKRVGRRTQQHAWWGQRLLLGWRVSRHDGHRCVTMLPLYAICLPCMYMIAWASTAGWEARARKDAPTRACVKQVVRRPAR